MLSAFTLAAAGIDCVARSSTLPCAVSDTVPQALGSSVNRDAAAEPDETFVLTLSSQSNSIIPEHRDVGSNLDDHEAWVVFQPNPQQTTIWIIVNAGRAEATTGIDFSDAGYRVNWGNVQQMGTTFIVNAVVERWTGPSAQVITPVTQDYDLGLLESGNYNFVFQANGLTVSQQPFGVAEESDTSPPDPPSQVTASDGTSPNHVRVQWGSVADANEYQVWRGVTDDSGRATRLAPHATITGNSFEDPTATPGTRYHYWVKAKNEAGPSDFSNYDEGFSGSIDDSGQGSTSVMIDGSTVAALRLTTPTGVQVTVHLRGAGTVEVALQGTDLSARTRRSGIVEVSGQATISQVQFHDTNSTTRLKFRTRPGDTVDVGSIVGTTPLGVLQAPGVNLVDGGLRLNGLDTVLGRATLNDVSNGLIDAQQIHRLNIRGTLWQSTLTAQVLGRIHLGGNLWSSKILAGVRLNESGAVASRQSGAIGSLAVRGSVIGSSVEAGFNGDDTDPRVIGGEHSQIGRISFGSFAVVNHEVNESTDDASRILAGALPDRIRVGRNTIVPLEDDRFVRLAAHTYAVLPPDGTFEQ
jgi:hypothetical protein